MNEEMTALTIIKDVTQVLAYLSASACFLFILWEHVRDYRR